MSSEPPVIKKRGRPRKVDIPTNPESLPVSDPERPPSITDKVPDTQQQTAALARWDKFRVEESLLREHFRKIELADGLKELEWMRQCSELAAKELNQRITGNEETARCFTCKGPRPSNGMWRLPMTRRDPKTGTLVSIYFCSDRCIALYNRDHTHHGAELVTK